MDVSAHIRQEVERTVAVSAAVAPRLCHTGAGAAQNVVTPHEAVMEGEKRRGRPQAVGKRPTFAFRMSEALHEQVALAARANGRSMSEELEHRLERSFTNDEMRSIIREELALATPKLSVAPVRVSEGKTREAIEVALRHINGFERHPRG